MPGSRDSGGCFVLIAGEDGSNGSGPDLNYLARGRVEAVEAAAGGSNPDISKAVLGDGPDLIAAEGLMRACRVVLVADKIFGVAVEEIKATVGADPEAALAVFKKGQDARRGEGIRAGRVVEVADELLPLGDKLIETVFGAGPEGAGAVDKEGIYPGVGQGMRVAFDGKVNGELVTVKLVEAGFGAEPEKALVVDSHGKD